MKRVETSAEADLHILEIDTWWRSERTKAPDLFATELEKCFALLERHPGAGKLVPGVEAPQVRRLPLKKTRHHVYYVDFVDCVLVVAVWGAPKRDGPNLAGPENV